MSSRRSQRGMVLLVVLWAIALCSALVMATSTTFRSLAGIVRIDRDRVQGGALLTAGLEGAAGIVAALRGGLLTERSVTLAFPTGSVRVTVTDEGGRIDIGKAPVELLTSLLRYVGAEDEDARIVAQRIVTFIRFATHLRNFVEHIVRNRYAGKTVSHPQAEDRRRSLRRSIGRSVH